MKIQKGYTYLRSALLESGLEQTFTSENGHIAKFKKRIFLHDVLYVTRVIQEQDEIYDTVMHIYYKSIFGRKPR